MTASCRSGTLPNGVPYCEGVESVTGGVTGVMTVDAGSLLQANKSHRNRIKKKFLFKGEKLNAMVKVR